MHICVGLHVLLHMCMRIHTHMQTKISKQETFFGGRKNVIFQSSLTGVIVGEMRILFTFLTFTLWYYCYFTCYELFSIQASKVPNLIQFYMQIE